LNIVGNQEKTILKRYRLINQKKYQEAYNLLNSPKQSFEEFVQMWKSYNLISVESINNPLIIFDTYGKLPANITASNYNIFEPKIFTRSQK
jgi:hypothetical protein